MLLSRLLHLLGVLLLGLFGLNLVLYHLRSLLERLLLDTTGYLEQAELPGVTPRVLAEVKAGRERAARQLSERFQVYIDRAAMRSGLFNTDDYLNEWRTSEALEREGEAEAVAEAVAAIIGKMMAKDPKARYQTPAQVGVG